MSDMFEAPETRTVAHASESSPQPESAWQDVIRRLERVETSLEGTQRQIGLMPAQVRALGTKVDALTTSIAEPRLRSILLALVGLMDLIDQARSFNVSDSTMDHASNYDVLRGQVRVILESNGIREVSASGEFDPQLHRALDTRSVDDHGLANQIIQIVRPGYRTDQSVLRFAEVVVTRYAEASTVVTAAEPVEPTKGE